MERIEYVRNLNHNYLRIRLEEKPQENKYQYCIIQRGGIKHLLACDLRYVNDEAFLYYDITSLQNLKQIFVSHKVDRKWFGDFLRGVEKMQRELYRFLLEGEHLMWNPEFLYQDFEKNDFYFQFIPYENHQSSFSELLDFFLEKLEYGDEAFVEFFYRMYDQYHQLGEDYLLEKVYEEFEALDKEVKTEKIQNVVKMEMPGKREEEGSHKEEVYDLYKEEKLMVNNKDKEKGKGIWSFLSGKKRNEEKLAYQEEIKRMMEEEYQYSSRVAEPAPSFETKKEEQMPDYGKTVFLEDIKEEERGLYKENGELLIHVTETPFLIGKKQEEVALCLSDKSVSRIHAQIIRKEDSFFLLDINSTNGTYKNGLRLQPYEERKLEKEDEIRLGNITLIFK